MTVGGVFTQEIDNYLMESASLLRAEARAREEEEAARNRARRTAGRRYAELLDLDPDRWWGWCAVLILSPSIEWRERACKVLLGAIRSTGAGTISPSLGERRPVNVVVH